jgi:hypothetical protein
MIEINSTLIINIVNKTSLPPKSHFGGRLDDVSTLLWHILQRVIHKTRSDGAYPSRHVILHDQLRTVRLCRITGVDLQEVRAEGTGRFNQ